MSRLFTTTVQPDFPRETDGETPMFEGSEMTSRHVRITTSAVDALMAAIDFRPSFTDSKRRDYASYAECAARAEDTFQVLSQICRPLGVDLLNPGFPPISPHGQNGRRAEAMRNAIRNSCQAVVEQMRSDRIGRLELLGDNAARYTFYETAAKRGVFQNALTRVKTTHEIVEAKAHSLPADFVPQPPLARHIVRQLLHVPALGRSSRIITGMMVSKESHVQDEWEEDTRFARGLKSAGGFVKKNIVGIGAGVGAAALATAALLAKPAAVAATAVAVADPAIVLGDIVFYGWE